MRRLNNNEGAVAVMAALLFATLLGIAAITVDVGALFSERRELQNGADAAVLAVAENCASGKAETACDVGPQGNRLVTARTFADRNARDGSAAVAENGVDVDYGASRAVVTATSLNDGHPFLRHWFTGLFGNGELATTEVFATATAIWGPCEVGCLNTLPLTFSQCEYATLGPGSAKEPWDAFTNGPPKIIWLQGGNAHQPTPECTGPAGQDLPGGFGWLDDISGASNKDECETEFTDDTAYSDPGKSSPCTAAWLEENIFNQVIFLPVFSDVNNSTKQYTFSTYAAFYVTGYNFGGQAKMPKSDPPCSPPEPDCIAGWFTGVEKKVVLDSPIDPNAPDTAVRAVQLVQN